MLLRVLRAEAWDREAGCCFVTGASLGAPDGPWHLHHRRPGGMGGTERDDQDSLPNVLALSRHAHEQLVHGRPTAARAGGWLLSPLGPRPPRALPARHWCQGWVWLPEGGGYAWVGQPEGQAASPAARPSPAP